MFPVAVGGRALEVGVELHDVARDVAQLVVRETGGLVDPFAPFGAAGEVAQPRDVLPQPPGGEVARHAHQQRHAQHEPQIGRIGREDFGERHGIGYGRADDPAVVGHGGIEVVAVRALRVAADGVTRAVAQGGGHFGAAEVVLVRQRVERVVEQYASRAVDERDAEVVERPPAAGRDPFGGLSGGVGVEHPQIDELQAIVEPFDLEPFFAAVLEQHETPHERPEEEEQPEEEAAVVGEPNP